jgi:hypothetical protein
MGHHPHHGAHRRNLDEGAPPTQTVTRKRSPYHQSTPPHTATNNNSRGWRRKLARSGHIVFRESVEPKPCHHLRMTKKEKLHGDAPNEENDAHRCSHHQPRQARQTLPSETSHPPSLLAEVPPPSNLLGVMAARVPPATYHRRTLKTTAPTTLIAAAPRRPLPPRFIQPFLVKQPLGLRPSSISSLQMSMKCFKFALSHTAFSPILQ